LAIVGFIGRNRLALPARSVTRYNTTFLKRRKIQGGPKNVDIALQTVTLSIVEKNFNFVHCLKADEIYCKIHVTFSTTPLKCCHFTLQNLKQNKNDQLLIHYSTFKIKQTIKMVKLFEKMFNVSSVVLDNSLKTFFHSSMLLLMKV